MTDTTLSAPAAEILAVIRACGPQTMAGLEIRVAGLQRFASLHEQVTQLVLSGQLEVVCGDCGTFKYQLSGGA